MNPVKLFCTACTLFISLTLGADQHQNGDTLESTAPIDMNKAVIKGQQVLDNLVASSDKLKDALEGFTAKGGDVAIADLVGGVGCSSANPEFDER